MKKHLLTSLLAIALLLETGGLIKPARAETLLSVQQETAQFEQALCRQDWQKALQISDLLMKSHEVSRSYKNTIEALQPLLEEYLRDGTYFDVSPWCGGAAGLANTVGSTIDNILLLRPYWSGLVRNGSTSEDAGGATAATGSGGPSVPSDSGSGNCPTPESIAQDGSRCGDRASSVRAGGR